MTASDPSPARAAPSATPGAVAPMAGDALFSSLYTELRRLARHAVWKHGGGMPISATTVLHQTYISMAGAGSGLAFPDKARFMGYASRAMRALIIDSVRRQQAQKRGGQFEFTPLNTQALQAPQAQQQPVSAMSVHEVHDPVDAQALEALSTALDELAKRDAALADLVDQKYFFGRNFFDIAQERGVSERTVQRDWATARGLLRLLMGETSVLDQTSPKENRHPHGAR